MINGKVEYTSVDELIKELQEISDRGLGDHPVCVNGVSPVHVSGRGYYYDGGYIVRDATKGNFDFVRSRMTNKKGRTTGMHPDVKDTCFDIDICDPTWDDEATIDGRTVRDMNPETWAFLDENEQEEMALFGGIVKYKLSKTKDENLNCYPYIAYLDSGESAVGSNMHNAKQNLAKIFDKGK